MAVHAESNIQLNTIPAQTSLLGGHFVYFQGNTGSGGNTPASANVIADSRYLSIPAQWGYNTHIGANGIKLRYNETTLSEWKADRLTFYKPGTNNPSLELISGINTALNIYNPTNNTKTLGLDISGLNFYGTSTSAPDVTLNADGLTLINGSIRGGIVGQDEFLYLSPQVFADEYEEYVLSEDTEVDETKIYYIRSGEEGAYIYTEVSEPTGNPQENEYYEIAHAPGTIPIDNYVKDNWRQIIGRKFAVDTDGNLYANGLNANNAHLQQAEVEGAIVATSLTIGSGSDAYDGAAAINISGYDIEIEKNGIDEVEGVSVYLYPILYHNGVQVPTIEVDYSHFIWYQDDDTIGTEGDGNNSGRYLATYGHNYRVIYDFDDGAVGGGTEVVDRTIDPSKYITKISDTGITIHPEVWTNQSSYIQLDGTGMELFNSNGNSIAQYGSTARVGLSNSSRFLMNSDSLEAYDSNNNKYFEVTSNGLSWGSNTAATISQFNTLNNYIDTHLAVTSEGLVLSADNNTKILIATGGQEHTYEDAGTYILDRSDNVLAQFLASGAQIGQSDSAHSIIDANGQRFYATNGTTQLANIGYGEGSNQSGGTSTKPYYSFGFRTTTNRNYDPTATYSYGDLCKYDNAIYVCKVDITTPEQWTSSHWKFYIGNYSMVAGAAVAAGYQSFASGNATHAIGDCSHAEGGSTDAIGGYSHAEGINTKAGPYAHAEGGSCWAMGGYSHAEGSSTQAPGDFSHAEGGNTRALGDYSHAQNQNTRASSNSQTALGKYNIEDSANTYAVIIGNGTNSTRSNALTVDWNGNTAIAGTLTQSSDRKLKDHISYLSTDANEFIRSLKPAYFKKDDQFHVGFYAQDVEQSDKWHCMTGEMNGFKTLGYTEIIAPLVAYCQHLEERIKQLEEK